MTSTEAPAPQADTTRGRILRAALELFAEHGYGATSMRQIAEQLGITKAALYYHFDSKEDIVHALLADVERQVRDLADWADDQEPRPDLAREVLLRWTDIMQTHGAALFRFIMSNRSVIEGFKTGHTGMIENIRRLQRILTPEGASVEDQLRIRLALMSVNLAGMVGAEIDASDEEILAVARRVAVDLLPR